MHTGYIAIDKGTRSKGYLFYLKKYGIRYKLVDCYSNTILKQLEDINGLIWHWRHQNLQDKLIARSILMSAQIKNLWVYPNINTCWYFDDKIAQKYLLEAVASPLVPTYIFFSLDDIYKNKRKIQLPTVVKKASGAGSQNVHLVSTYKELLNYAKIQFGKETLFQIIQNYIKDRNLDNKILTQTDKGYILLQTFVPNNEYDIRVSIINERAVIFKRYVRDNDFRASGSGKIDYNVSNLDKTAIPIAFETIEKIKAQVLAFDFVLDQNHHPKIIEISYGFMSKAVSNAPGWYDKQLNFHREPTVVEEEVVKAFIHYVNSN